MTLAERKDMHEIRSLTNWGKEEIGMGRVKGKKHHWIKKMAGEQGAGID